MRDTLSSKISRIGQKLYEKTLWTLSTLGLNLKTITVNHFKHNGLWNDADMGTKRPQIKLNEGMFVTHLWSSDSEQVKIKLFRTEVSEWTWGGFLFCFLTVSYLRNIILYGSPSKFILESVEYKRLDIRPGLTWKLNKDNRFFKYIYFSTARD